MVSLFAPQGPGPAATAPPPLFADDNGVLDQADPLLAHAPPPLTAVATGSEASADTATHAQSHTGGNGLGASSPSKRSGAGLDHSSASGGGKAADDDVADDDDEEFRCDIAGLRVCLRRFALRCVLCLCWP